MIYFENEEILQDILTFIGMQREELSCSAIFGR